MKKHRGLCSVVALVIASTLASAETINPLSQPIPGYAEITTRYQDTLTGQSAPYFGVATEVEVEDHGKRVKLWITDAHLMGEEGAAAIELAGKSVRELGRRVDSTNDVAVVQVAGGGQRPFAQLTLNPCSMNTDPATAQVWLKRNFSVAAASSYVVLTNVLETGSDLTQGRHSFVMIPPFFVDPKWEGGTDYILDFDPLDDLTQFKDVVASKRSFASRLQSDLFDPSADDETAFGRDLIEPKTIPQGFSGSPLFETSISHDDLADIPAGSQQAAFKITGLFSSTYLPFHGSYFTPTSEVCAAVSDYLHGRRGQADGTRWRSRKGLLYQDFGGGTQDANPVAVPAAAGGYVPPGGGYVPPGGGPPSKEAQAGLNYYQTYGLKPGILSRGKPTIAFDFGDSVVWADSSAIRLMRSLPVGAAAPIPEGSTLVDLLRRKFKAQTNEFYGAVLYQEDDSRAVMLPKNGYVAPALDGIDDIFHGSRGYTVSYRNHVITVKILGDSVEGNPFRSYPVNVKKVLPNGAVETTNTTPDVSLGTPTEAEFQLDENGALIGSGNPSFAPFIQVKDVNGRKVIVDLRGLFFTDLDEVKVPQDASMQARLQAVRDDYNRGPELWFRQAGEPVDHIVYFGKAHPQSSDAATVIGANRCVRGAGSLENLRQALLQDKNTLSLFSESLTSAWQEGNLAKFLSVAAQNPSNQDYDDFFRSAFQYAYDLALPPPVESGWDDSTMDILATMMAGVLNKDPGLIARVGKAEHWPPMRTLRIEADTLRLLAGHSSVENVERFDRAAGVTRQINQSKLPFALISTAFQTRHWDSMIYFVDAGIDVCANDEASQLLQSLPANAPSVAKRALGDAVARCQSR